MDKPTKAQIIKFWEWCGFKQRDVPSLAWYYESNGAYLWEYYKLPPIDLNNLFKYAVPKLMNYTISRFDNYTRVQIGETIVFNEDPALALFLALDKVREVK